MSKETQKTFVPIRRAASNLGVPITWLQVEAKAGRIPAIKAGRRWLVHLEHARLKLAEYAEREGGPSEQLATTHTDRQSSLRASAHPPQAGSRESPWRI